MPRICDNGSDSLRRGPQRLARQIYLVAVAEGTEAVADVGPFGARVVFCDGGSGTSEEQVGEPAKAGDITFSLGPRESVVLQPVAVRKQVLPPQALTDRLQQYELNNHSNSGEPETVMDPSQEEGSLDSTEEEGPQDEAEFGEVNRPDDNGDSDVEPAQRFGESDGGLIKPTPVTASGKDIGMQPALVSTMRLDLEEIEEPMKALDPPYRVQCFGSFEVTNAGGEPVVWGAAKVTRAPGIPAFPGRPPGPARGSGTSLVAGRSTGSGGGATRPCGLPPPLGLQGLRRTKDAGSHRVQPAVQPAA
jgi:hypothetical protein